MHKSETLGNKTFFHARNDKVLRHKSRKAGVVLLADPKFLVRYEGIGLSMSGALLLRTMFFRSTAHFRLCLLMMSVTSP